MSTDALPITEGIVEQWPHGKTAVTSEAISLGQAYVNNDACYPAIVAIGKAAKGA